MKNKINNTVFWLKNGLRRQAILQYKEAIRNQYDAEALNAASWGGQKLIVEHAYNNCHFYKDFYDQQGFHPSMLLSPSDWEKVPILEKWMVRENTKDLLASNAPKDEIGISTTGGSTGTPLKIYTDNRFKFEILGWRAFSWWNVSPGDNVGIAHRRVPTKWAAKLKNRLLWWPTKRLYLSATSLNSDEIKHFVEQIDKKQIVWLQGYVGALEKIADYILENHVEIKSLKMVWSTSAPLTKNVRQKMEKAFDCKVMNQYGSCEVPNIAIQCPNSPHLHVNEDFVHVDVVDKDNKPIIGEEGDILVTNLRSFHFPLIKYRLGDRGTLLDEECECGIKLPLLKEVKGRISDAIYTPDGLYVDGSYLTTLFDDYSEHINQFQIRQKSDYSITLYVKTWKDDNETRLVLEKICNKLKEIVRYQVPVSLELVENINDDKGKIRYILSDIALEKIKSEQHK